MTAVGSEQPSRSPREQSIGYIPQNLSALRPGANAYYERPYRITGPDRIVRPSSSGPDRVLYLTTDEIDAFNRLVTSPEGTPAIATASLLNFGVCSLRSIKRQRRAYIPPEVIFKDERTGLNEDIALPEADPRISGEAFIASAREQLSLNSFVIMSEHEIQLHPEMRSHLLARYFNTDAVRHHPGDIPSDRERARDVVRYAFLPKGILFTENETCSTIDSSLFLASHLNNTVGDRQHSNISDRPVYSRIEVTEDQHLAQLVRQILACVPLNDRERVSTVGVNWFRTHTDVVAQPHQDEERYVVIYVVDKQGSGAHTQLFNCRDGDTSLNPSFSGELLPGQLLMFKDSRFKHITHPITPPPQGKARRDAMILTVDHASTHAWHVN